MMTKRIVIFLVLCNIANLTLSQTDSSFWVVDKNDQFNDVNTPISGGFELWLMRQNLTTKGYQSVFEYEHPMQENGIHEPQYINFTNYFQLFNKSKVSSMAGLRYKSFNLMTNEDIVKNYQHAWLWNVWQYNPGNKWNFKFAYEFFKAGNINNFNTYTGDRFFYYFIPSYAINKHLLIIPFAGYDYKYMDNHKVNSHFLAGLQIKWVPNSNFKITTGFPLILATEWAFSNKLNFGFYGWYDLQNTTFLQYKFSNKGSISLHYSNDKDFNNVYNSNSDFIYENQTYSYNRIDQRQHKFALQLNLKTSPTTSVQATIGYKKGDNVKLLYNDEEQCSITGKDYFFVGLSFYLVNLHPN